MKYILLIITFIIIGLILFAVLTETGSDEIQYTTESISLACPNNATMTIQYDTSGEYAQLSLSGVQYELTRVQSASGARYESTDGQTSFWEHQGEVEVRLPNMSEALTCYLDVNSHVRNNYEDWETFSSATTNPPTITLNHPKGTNITQVKETVYEFSYIGPESEPNTEITDGYYGTIEIISNSEGVEAYAAANDDVDGTAVRVNFTGHDAYRYQEEPVLGDGLVSHYVLAIPNAPGQLADISYQTFSDPNGTYESEILRMLTSLRFGATEANAGSDIIKITTPMANATVGNPITLAGEARGQWFFEATAPVVVTDWDGRIIGESFITADGEWMTEDFVPFAGTIEYDLPRDSYSASGTLIFQRSNPSGLPENDAAVEVPIVLDRD